MNEVLWRLFIDAKIAEYYFLAYARRSNFYLFLLNAICLIASFSGIGAWLTNNLPPLQSSLIVLASQILCALQPLYPFSKRLYAADCIYNAYGDASLRAEQLLNRVLYGPLDPQEVPTQVEALQVEISSIEGKFSSASDFPQNMGFHKKAERAAMQYLNTHFSTGGTGNERQNQ